MLKLYLKKLRCGNKLLKMTYPIVQWFFHLTRDLCFCTQSFAFQCVVGPKTNHVSKRIHYQCNRNIKRLQCPTQHPVTRAKSLFSVRQSEQKSICTLSCKHGHLFTKTSPLMSFTNRAKLLRCVHTKRFISGSRHCGCQLLAANPVAVFAEGMHHVFLVSQRKCETRAWRLNVKSTNVHSFVFVLTEINTS